MIARTAAAVRPLLAMTRCTCISSGQSTTRTRCTRPLCPPRSNSSGTTSRPYGLFQRRDIARGRGADQRMQDGLEQRARRGVVEYALAQPRAVERAIGKEVARSECFEDSRVARLARGGDRMRDGVGVGDIGAQRGERIGHGRLAAADATREPDDQRHLSLPGERTAN